jgi:telomerase reverse transcriptase
MRSKRKRNVHGEKDGSHSKRQKILAQHPGAASVVRSALLRQFYPQVLSLKEYMLARLPSQSKVRRKKIRDVVSKNSDDEFAHFLEQTLIGVNHDRSKKANDRWQDWNTFSQKTDESISTLANLTGLSKFSQSEVRMDSFSYTIDEN